METVRNERRNTGSGSFKEFKLSPIVAKILINRQITDLETANRYLNSHCHDLHSPYLMKDMKQGVERLIRAVQGGKSCRIWRLRRRRHHSLACLYRFLQEFTTA